MNIRCNAGKTTTNLIGDLPGYRTVWYHPNGIANILSLKKVKEKYHVTYDSWDGNKFIVSGSGVHREFKQSPRGLYHMVVSKEATTLVNTVDEISS